MDRVREDMKIVGVTGEDTRERVRWSQMSHCGGPESSQKTNFKLP